MSNDPSRRGVIGGALASAVTVAAGAGAGPAFAASASDSAAADPFPEGDAGLADPWRAILADSDLVWQRMPTSWDEGPFLGNAILGTGIYAEPHANAVRFTVQHSEVQDHRPEFGSLFGLGRLPVGAFTLDPVGTITGVDWRLDLWNAGLTGSVTTTAGRLDLRALVHSARAVLAVEVTPSSGEAGFGWTYQPAVAISPRAAFKPPPPGYAANPPAVVGVHGSANTAVQTLTAGGGHTTAWRLVRRGSTHTLYAAVAHSFPSADHLDTAVRTMTDASRLPFVAAGPGSPRGFSESTTRSRRVGRTC